MIVAEACDMGDLYAHASKMSRYYIRRPGIRRQHLTLSSTDIEFGLQEKNKWDYQCLFDLPVAYASPY
jgi:hypothetical protein